MAAGDENHRSDIEALLRPPHRSDVHFNRFISQTPVLKKMVQLKSIEDQLENSVSVYESVLSHLELIEEADRAAGIAATAAMKLAYCDTAVACTVQHLSNEDEFRASVERIWKRRVEKITITKGLFSEDLWIWKGRIEDSSFDRNIDYGDIAVKSVKRYVEVAWSAVERALVESPPAVDVGEGERLRGVRILDQRRRTTLRWKPYEVDALKRGVRLCGVGNWQSISLLYKDVFARRRTDVDLKDKWRNMGGRRYRR